MHPVNTLGYITFNLNLVQARRLARRALHSQLIGKMFAILFRAHLNQIRIV